MKRLGASVLVVVLLLITLLLLAPRFGGEKGAALGEVGTALFTSEYHHGIILEGGKRLLDAEYNHAVIARASRYAGMFGSNTGIYRGIAGIAADADREEPRLEAALDLAVMSQGNGAAILALAERACLPDSLLDEAAWQRTHDALMAQRDWPSVEAAEAGR